MKPDDLKVPRYKDSKLKFLKQETSQKGLNKNMNKQKQPGGAVAGGVVPNFRTVKIMNICKGQLIGWEDIIADRNTTINLNCITNSGKLLSIDSKEFLRLVQSNG